MVAVRQNIRIEAVASTETIDTAYQWFCHRRQKQQHNADIWDLRWRWEDNKPRIQQALRAGNYRFAPLDWFLSQEGDLIELYSARDALVLKAFSY
jgi:hypothetical protein